MTNHELNSMIQFQLTEGKVYLLKIKLKFQSASRKRKKRAITQIQKIIVFLLIPTMKIILAFIETQSNLGWNDMSE